VKVDSKNEAYYRANLKSYQAELTALDEEIRLDLSGLPRKTLSPFMPPGIILPRATALMKRR